MKKKRENKQAEPLNEVKEIVPYCCPVCGGRGQVRGDFYFSYGTTTTAASSTELCRTCGGSGVIWAEINTQYVSSC